MFYDTITSHDNLCYSRRVVTASEHCNVYALNNPYAENDHIDLLIQSKSFVTKVVFSLDSFDCLVGVVAKNKAHPGLIHFHRDKGYNTCSDLRQIMMLMKIGTEPIV